jgi:hypothetical protein
MFKFDVAPRAQAFSGALLCLQTCSSHKRFKQRVGTDNPISGRASGAGSAFTSYIAAADLQQAISKYRASGCSEAYYLLTAGAQGCHISGGLTTGSSCGSWARFCTI